MGYKYMVIFEISKGFCINLYTFVTRFSYLGILTPISPFVF